MILRSKLFLISITISLVLASQAMAMSSKRPEPEPKRVLENANAQTRESLWSRLHAGIVNLREDFSDVRRALFERYLTGLQLKTIKEVKEAHLNDVRCTDDQITSPGDALHRLNWAYGCLMTRKNKMEGEERGRYTIEEMLLNDQITNLLNEQIVSAKSGSFKYPTLGQIDRGTFQIARGKGLAWPDMGSCKVFEENPNVTVVGLCNPGCFAPEQLVLFSQGYVPIGDATIAHTPKVVTMDSKAELETATFKTTPVDQLIKTPQDANRRVYEIKTTEGYRLRVSQEHPILLKNGVMRQASLIRVGNQLLALDGQNADGTSKLKPVTVTSVENKPYHGNFINLDVISSDPKENIIVANGLLVGTNLYQVEKGRVYLEKKLFQALLPATATRD